MDTTVLENIFTKHGFGEFKWIKPQDIVFAQWVKFKCMFGCPSYGQRGTCPPNVPSIPECKDFISEYSSVIVFRIEQQLNAPGDRWEWSNGINKKLLGVERDVFLTGHRKAFLLFMDECRMCNECTDSRSGCKNKRDSRPSPESLGIDVFATAENSGFPIEVLTDYSDTMNRYAFLFID